MYIKVFFIFLAIVSIVLINVILVNHLKEFSGLNLFSVLAWVNINLLAIFVLLFVFARNVYKHWTEVKTSDLKKKLVIVILTVLGFPFIFLTGLVIVGKTSYLRVFTEESLKRLVVETEHVKRELSNIKVENTVQRRRLLEELNNLESEARSLRQLVKRQKLVLINFISTFVVIALAVLLGAVALALFLVRIISAPVEIFSGAMRRLAEGDFSDRAKVDLNTFPIKQVKELKEFAENYNLTVDKLAEMYKKLEREKFLFESIFNNVSTGVALFHQPTGELIKANKGYKTGIGITDLQTLREWIKDKDFYRYEEKDLTPLTLVFVEDLTPFVINKRYKAWKEIAERLAHDIKNPLNAIQLQLELFERVMEKQPQRAAEFFQNIKRDIFNQIRYVTDLIDSFNNLSSEDVELKKEFFSLRQLLFEVKKAFETDTFKVYIETSPVWIRADRKALKRVFENLVKNAYEVLQKTGKKGGYIRIKTVGNEIHIVDNGPGIPPDKADKVFLPFVSTKGKGRGLGLFNVKRIVEEHGWSISLLPPRQGEGAHFVITVDPRDIKKKLPRSGGKSSS